MSKQHNFSLKSEVITIQNKSNTENKNKDIGRYSVRFFMEHGQFYHSVTFVKRDNILEKTG